MSADERRIRTSLQRAGGSLDELTVQQSAWEGPTPGSPAAQDDAVWPSSPPSSVVRNSILSGVEHAQLLRVLLTASEPWPATVLYSTMRGVLIGGCQALWVVGCAEPALRRARALAITREDYRLRRAHHVGQSTSQDPDRAAHAAGWVTRWDRRFHQLDIVTVKLPKVDRLRLTDVIEWVGRDFLDDGSDARAALLSTWQICSGYAHALPGARPVDPEGTGPGWYTVELDWEHAATEALNCMQILLIAHRYAWEWSGRTEATPGPIRY
jgi:hypothetical protein